MNLSLEADKVADSSGTPPPSEQKASWLMRVANKWYFALLVGVLAFLLGSLKSDSIKQAFPNCCWVGLTNYPANPFAWNISKSAVAFWLLTSVWAVLVGHRYKAESDRADSIRRSSEQLAADVKTVQNGAENLEKMVAKIQSVVGEVKHAVETLPSKEFRTDFQIKSDIMHVLLGTTLPRSPGAGCDTAAVIRSLLDNVLSLRRVYENNDKGRYAANVMIYVRADDAPPYLSDDIFLKICAMAPNPQVTAVELRGALVLYKALSTSTDLPVGQVDTKITEIALGIHRSAELSQKGSPWVLPGAVDSFLTSSQKNDRGFYVAGISGHYDTSKIEELNSVGYNIPQNLLQTLKRYFETEDGRLIRSFITVPLRHPNLQPFGVLNIHSDGPWQSGNQPETQMNFGLIVTPLVNQIAEACILWAAENGIGLQVKQR